MAARWSEGAIEVLKRGWGVGMSGSDIAMLLNNELGGRFTRNMVIGKAHRLGLEPRPSPIVRSA